MNDIKVWNYNNSEIRTIEKDGEPWFVAKDIATVLGYKNTKDAVARHVDQEDSILNGVVIPDPIGREQTYRIINESGLYSLILSSKMPDAKKFKRWVTSEVLPTIRKHGAYMTEQTIEKALFNPDFLIELATQLKNEQARSKQLETTVVVQEQQIKELKPKADYTDKILQNKGLVAITQIAKDYGMSGNKLNEKLHELGIQYKLSSQWLLYAKYQDKGYTHSETVNITRSDGRPDIKMNTKWTQKGRLFLYNLLKANGILPIIERDEKTAPIVA